MPDPITPNTLMSQLRAQVDVLNDFVMMCARQSVVYEIPFYVDGEVPDVIEVTRHTEETAIKMATDAFRNYSQRKEQSRGSVYRLPGVITVDRDLRSGVERVNAVKDELQKLIKKEYPDYKARNAFCRQAFPGRVMLQVYRKLQTNEREVQKIRFSWMPITRATKKVTRSQAMEMLIKRGTVLGRTSDSDSILAVKMAFRVVANSPPTTQYVIIKPRAPYPTVVVYYKDRATNEAPHTIPTSLPLIIAPTVEPIDIGVLPPLDTKAERKSRKTKKETRSVYKPLNLYAYV